MTATAILVAYATLAVAMVALELWARRRPERGIAAGHVVAVLMRTHPGRWFVLLGWWWLGWHLFVRSTP